jgi:hypothetical protein
MAESHVFVHDTEGGGLHHREVRIDDDGGMTLIGHDLGETEYEFERRVSPDGVRRLLASVAGGGSRPPHDPLLYRVRDAFTSTRDIEQRLEQLQIDTEFWNRFG